ncbi:MAG TPA: hypothetical protein VI756_19075 [Blastocatellia bacterium]
MSETVSFEKDIAPVFRQFRGSMMWRFDLTKYEDVKANATGIYQQIQPGPGGAGMPPPPYPPLTSQQVATFKTWMDEGFPK